MPDKLVADVKQYDDAGGKSDGRFDLSHLVCLQMFLYGNIEG